MGMRGRERQVERDRWGKHDQKTSAAGMKMGDGWLDCGSEVKSTGCHSRSPGFNS